MKYVVDSGDFFKTLVAEQHSDKALRLRADFRNGVHELLAPDIFLIETAHSISKAERQGRVTPAEGVRLLTDALAGSPILHPHLALLPRAYQMSSTTRSAVYDCLYVALAEREAGEFITADQRLLNNLRGLYPLVDLTTWP